MHLTFAQLQRLRDEDGRRITLLEQKIKIYEEELLLAEKRFRSRAPRDEDVARISELESQLQDRERRLA